MNPDTDRSVAFDPTAPPDEHNDALAELQKFHIPSNVLMSETLVRIFEMAECSPMNKAIDKNVVPFLGRFRGKPGMQSVALDELQLGLQCEYWEKPAAVNFEALQHIVDQTPVFSAVVMTRIRQVQRFCRVLSRAMVVRRKTQRPAQFELTEPTRTAVAAWIAKAALRFPESVNSTPLFGRPLSMARARFRMAGLAHQA